MTSCPYVSQFKRVELNCAAQREWAKGLLGQCAPSSSPSPPSPSDLLGRNSLCGTQPAPAPAPSDPLGRVSHFWGEQLDWLRRSLVQLHSASGSVTRQLQQGQPHACLATCSSAETLGLQALGNAPCDGSRHSDGGSDN